MSLQKLKEYFSSRYKSIDNLYPLPLTIVNGEQQLFQNQVTNISSKNDYFNNGTRLHRLDEDMETQIMHSNKAMEPLKKNERTQSSNISHSKFTKNENMSNDEEQDLSDLENSMLESKRQNDTQNTSILSQRTIKSAFEESDSDESISITNKSVLQSSTSQSETTTKSNKHDTSKTSLDNSFKKYKISFDKPKVLPIETPSKGTRQVSCNGKIKKSSKNKFDFTPKKETNEDFYDKKNAKEKLKKLSQSQLSTYEYSIREETENDTTVNSLKSSNVCSTTSECDGHEISNSIENSSSDHPVSLKNSSKSSVTSRSLSKEKSNEIGKTSSASKSTKDTDNTSEKNDKYDSKSFENLLGASQNKLSKSHSKRIEKSLESNSSRNEEESSGTYTHRNECDPDRELIDENNNVNNDSIKNDKFDERDAANDTLLDVDKTVEDLNGLEVEELPKNIEVEQENLSKKENESDCEMQLPFSHKIDYRVKLHSSDSESEIELKRDKITPEDPLEDIHIKNSKNYTDEVTTTFTNDDLTDDIQLSTVNESTEPVAQESVDELLSPIKKITIKEETEEEMKREITVSNETLNKGFVASTLTSDLFIQTTTTSSSVTIESNNKQQNVNDDSLSSEISNLTLGFLAQNNNKTQEDAKTNEDDTELVDTLESSRTKRVSIMDEVDVVSLNQSSCLSNNDETKDDQFYKDKANELLQTHQLKSILKTKSMIRNIESKCLSIELLQDEETSEKNQNEPNNITRSLDIVKESSEYLDVGLSLQTEQRFLDKMKNHKQVKEKQLFKLTRYTYKIPLTDKRPKTQQIKNTLMERKDKLIVPLNKHLYGKNYYKNDFDEDDIEDNDDHFILRLNHDKLNKKDQNVNESARDRQLKKSYSNKNHRKIRKPLRNSSKSSERRTMGQVKEKSPLQPKLSTQSNANKKKKSKKPMYIKKENEQEQEKTSKTQESESPLINYSKFIKPIRSSDDSNSLLNDSTLKLSATPIESPSPASETYFLSKEIETILNNEIQLNTGIEDLKYTPTIAVSVMKYIQQEQNNNDAAINVLTHKDNVEHQVQAYHFVASDFAENKFVKKLSRQKIYNKIPELIDAMRVPNTTPNLISSIQKSQSASYLLGNLNKKHNFKNTKHFQEYKAKMQEQFNQQTQYSFDEYSKLIEMSYRYFHEPITIVSQHALNYMPTQRIRELAKPRIKKDHLTREEFPKDNYDPLYSGVLNKAALVYKSTDRIEELSRPKTVCDTYRFPKRLPELVRRGAKTAEPSERIINLSKPKSLL